MIDFMSPMMTPILCLNLSHFTCENMFRGYDVPKYSSFLPNRREKQFNFQRFHVNFQSIQQQGQRISGIIFW